MQTQVEIEFGRWAENKHNELNEDGMLEGQGQLQVVVLCSFFPLRIKSCTILQLLPSTSCKEW